MLASRGTSGIIYSEDVIYKHQKGPFTTTSKIQYPTLISMSHMLDKLHNLVKKGRAFSSPALLNLESVLDEHLNVKLDLQ